MTIVSSQSHLRHRRLRAHASIRLTQEQAKQLGSELSALREGVFDAAISSEVASSNANSVAEAAHRVADHVNEISVAINEFSTSIVEISQNAAESARVVTAAAAASEASIELVQRLSDSSSAIGDMLDLISRIAAQTDLLALNATIEAARAGEAGRGFAVVASEVKELARGTSNATQQITEVVHRIRTDAAAAAASISNIASLVEQFNERHSSIAAAVEQQAAATHEIGRSLHGAVTEGDTMAQRILRVANEAYQATFATSMAKHAATQVATEFADWGITSTDPAAKSNPLRNAIAAHSDWKARLVFAVESGSKELSVDTVRQRDKCAFGKWLHGDIDAASRNTDDYNIVTALHAQFHEEAAAVLTRAQSGQKTEALAAIETGTPFATVSASLTNAIENWQTTRPSRS